MISQRRIAASSPVKTEVGKTLSIRLLELAGKWAANPSRFHFREMEKLAAKTDVVELSITVRSTIIQGRDKYVNALAWAAEFELDTDFFQTNARTAFSEYDYAIDTAQLVETTVYFEDAPRIQRRKKLELHYMARHHDYRDEEDVIFADHNPDFLPNTTSNSQNITPNMCLSMQPLSQGNGVN